MKTMQPIRLAVVIVAAVAVWSGCAAAVSFESSTNYASGVDPFDAVMGDFDGDGHLDLAVSNSSIAYSNTVSIWLGDGTGALGTRTDYSTGYYPKGLATGDLDSDGNLDLVVANGEANATSSVSVLLGNGDGGFQSPVSYSVAEDPDNVVLADFNEDGNLDVAASSDSIPTSNVSVLLGNGDGTLSSAVRWAIGGAVYIAVADVNGDGHLDIIGDNLHILLGNGDGTFNDGGTIDGTPGEGIAVGDLNRDGLPDIAVTYPTYDLVGVYLGRGAGIFGSQVNYAVGYYPSGIAMADLSGDGQMDLVTSNYHGHDVSVLVGKGDGTFETYSDFSAAEGPLNAAVGDLNEDGKLDIAVAALNADSVSVLLNDSPTVPNYTQSYFVPQAGSVGSPTEGTAAVAYFRGCPNNDGASFPNNARIKVVLHDTLGNPVQGVSAADVCILFNGGTAAQGFSGSGADSVIANSEWNQAPLCPDVRCVQADSATNASGVTYITFHGATPGTPGVASRDSTRKWGHYDSDLPVFALGTRLQGRLTSAGENGSYVLRIKNFDVTGGLGAALNQGEAVTTADYNLVAGSLGKSNLLTYWVDFDGNGTVSTTDLNMLGAHQNHNCQAPSDP